MYLLLTCRAYSLLSGREIFNDTKYISPYYLNNMYMTFIYLHLSNKINNSRVKRLEDRWSNVQ